MLELPQRTTQPSYDRTQARLVFWICLVCTLGVGTIWTVAQVRGLNTGWDEKGVPFVVVGDAIAAWTIYRKPWLVHRAALMALMGASIFCLGAVYYSATRHDQLGWASMSSTTQFMPLLYVAAFVSLKRGATWYSWAHYAGLVALYIVAFGWPWAQHDPDALSVHLWTSVLSSNPAYILSLHYITALKGRLTAKEIEHQQSKERFLAMLSHEIRTPLQAMLGSIDLLGLKARTEAERRAVERLRGSATQLDTHLRDVTEYTRLENPAWQLREEPVDLAALCREVIDAHQAQATTRHLALRFELRDHPDDAPEDGTLRSPAWAFLTTDGRRLRQVLNNLISNALKYTPSGEVVLRLQGPSPQSPQPSRLSLSISDTGIGIPADRLQQIFEPYVRLEDPRVAHEDGSGLGLAVVQLLVRRLGLSLSVDSPPGQGTTFHLRWPMA